MILDAQRLKLSSTLIEGTARVLWVHHRLVAGTCERKREITHRDKKTFGSHWSGLSTLVYATVSMLGSHWNSSWLSCCWPVLGKSFSFGSAEMIPLHAPADHRWRAAQMGQPSWFWAWVVEGLVSLSAFPCTRALLHCLEKETEPTLLFSCPQGRISHIYTFKLICK